MTTDCKHQRIQTWRFEDSAEVAGMWSCTDCGRRFEPVAAAQAGAEPVDTGWLQSGGLLYRLTDGRRPENRDEIRVSMADGSRSDESCTRRAGELLDRINGVASTAQPAPLECQEQAQAVAAAYCRGHDAGWQSCATHKESLTVAAAPLPAREPLTSDAAHELFELWYDDDNSGVEFVRMIEAAHGITAAKDKP